MGVQWQGALAKGKCARILTYIVSDTKIESHTFWSFVLQLPYIYTPFNCYTYLKVFVVVMWAKLYIENITLLYVKKFKLFDNKVDIYIFQIKWICLIKSFQWNQQKQRNGFLIGPKVVTWSSCDKFWTYQKTVSIK